MTEQCPNCGRYVANEAEGFYGRMAAADESTHGVCGQFCNEACANAYYVKRGITEGDWINVETGDEPCRLAL